MPIQQHPLPQDISSYKFRLIGDMTIKQFLYIAGFVILTILIHQSPIPFFFRYPLEILTLGLGIGLAFMPIQGRPLDQWIIAFIKSIYSPTQYVWKQHQQEKITKTTTQKVNLSTQVLPKQKIGTTTSTTTLDLTPSHRGPTLKGAATATGPLTIGSKEGRTPIGSDDKIKKPLPAQVLPEQKLGAAQTPTVKPSLPTNQGTTPKTEGAAPTANLPIPFTPEQPNTIVGLTLNPQGLILDGVLIEIISGGLTTRATKSNKLGQFLFAKALENGLYQIKAEKDNFQFTTYSINLEGNIVKPLKIQAKS